MHVSLISGVRESVSRAITAQTLKVVDPLTEKEIALEDKEVRRRIRE